MQLDFGFSVGCVVPGFWLPQILVEATVRALFQPIGGDLSFLLEGRTFDSARRNPDQSAIHCAVPAKADGAENEGKASIGPSRCTEVCVEGQYCNGSCFSPGPVSNASPAQAKPPTEHGKPCIQRLQVGPRCMQPVLLRKCQASNRPPRFEPSNKL